jgi:hypothetical protein
MALTAAQKKAAEEKYKKDTLGKQTLAEKYGYVSALINSNSELRSLFAKAYGTSKSGQWTSERFQAALRNTKWYKNHSEQWRKTEALRLGDPTEFKARVKQSTQEIKAIAGAMGANLTDDQAASLGNSYFRAGYDQNQIRQNLMSYVTSGEAGEYGGAAGQAFQELRQYGDNMGIKRDATWYQGAVRSIAAGLSTVEDWTGDIAAEAQSMYAPFAERIAQGMTVRDLASGYINTMAETLEIDPDEIGLDDATVQQALKGGMDQKGNPYAQSLWDFEKNLRGDARWQSTKNANQQANQTALSVLQAFGFQG